MVYGIETNFIAVVEVNSMKLLVVTKSCNGNRSCYRFYFGVVYRWQRLDKARNNLEETFDAMEHIYNIKDLEDGIIEEIMI